PLPRREVPRGDLRAPRAPVRGGEDRRGEGSGSDPGGGPRDCARPPQQAEARPARHRRDAPRRRARRPFRPLPRCRCPRRGRSGARSSLRGAETPLLPFAVMIFRNTAGYFAARALPAVLTVVAIAVYTRLLEPREYGRYALVFSAVVLFNIAFFYWIKVALVRFHAAHAAAPGVLYRSVLACYGMTCAGVAAIGALALAVAWDDPAWRALVALAVPLVCVQGWFELNLSLATAQARPARFGLLSGTKALVAL